MRSDRVEGVKAALVCRIAAGRPGERFLSNRALAAKHGLSYQTADRLIRELCKEGYLERRPASGTYLPGRIAPMRGAFLGFHSRAQRSDSFGARLLMELTSRLDREGIPYRVAFDDEAAALILGEYPVLWDWGGDVPRSGLLLHRRPASGMDSTHWDSVTVDDFSGGVCAAQLLRERVPRGSRWVVLGGPHDDARSKARVEGFRSLLRAESIPAGWFTEDGERVATQVLASHPDGVFCANDRLAEGLLRHAARAGLVPPPCVGFDDAPVAERLNLTTIAIPWKEMTLAAATTIRQRLADPRGAGIHQVVAPRPVIRW